MAYACMDNAQSGGGELKIFSGNANIPLAENICTYLEMPLGAIQVSRFSDGEIMVEIKENVRGKDVFVIQPTCRPVNENLMELLIVMDALKRASAGCITAVVPYYAYARQDSKIAPRMAIAAKLVADLISTSGAQRLVTMDLHAGQIQGFFDIPVDHLYAIPVLVNYIKDNFAPDLAIVSPDTGGVERARSFARHLQGNLAIIDKRRDGATISAMTLIGNVWGKEAVIIDDLVNTGGTLSMAAEVLMRHGARSVHACVTHPVLAGDSVTAIKKSLLRSLITTDTIPLSEDGAACDKIKVLAVAPLLGEAIRRIHNKDSVSSLFI